MNENGLEAALATFANLLTLLRILAVPAIVIFILRSGDGSSMAALAIFIAAAFTDFLDGLIARSTGSISELGKKIDPFADRLLISGTIIALAIMGVLPAIGVFLVAARDLYIVIGYKVLQRRGITLRVSLLGKAYTALFMIAIVAAMAGIEPAGVRLGWWLFWIGVAGSLITGVAYTVRGLASIRRQKPFDYKLVSPKGE